MSDACERAVDQQTFNQIERVDWPIFDTCLLPFILDSLNLALPNDVHDFKNASVDEALKLVRTTRPYGTGCYVTNSGAADIWMYEGLKLIGVVKPGATLNAGPVDGNLYARGFPVPVEMDYIAVAINSDLPSSYAVIGASVSGTGDGGVDGVAVLSDISDFGPDAIQDLPSSSTPYLYSGSYWNLPSTPNAEMITCVNALVNAYGPSKLQIQLLGSSGAAAAVPITVTAYKGGTVSGSGSPWTITGGTAVWTQTFTVQFQAALGTLLGTLNLEFIAGIVSYAEIIMPDGTVIKGIPANAISIDTVSRQPANGANFIGPGPTGNTGFVAFICIDQTDSTAGSKPLQKAISMIQEFMNESDSSRLLGVGFCAFGATAVQYVSPISTNIPATLAALNAALTQYTGASGSPWGSGFPFWFNQDTTGGTVDGMDALSTAASQLKTSALALNAQQRYIYLVTEKACSATTSAPTTIAAIGIRCVSVLDRKRRI